MTHADFIHLRVHSAYSLLEGAIKIKDLVDLCAANSMPAVAVTDTCNLFGAMEFSSPSGPGGPSMKLFISSGSVFHVF